MKKAKDFREMARNALRGRWLWAVLAGVIAAIFGVTEGFLPDINVQMRDGIPHINSEFFGQTISLDGFLREPAFGSLLVGGVTFFVLLGLAIALVQLILGGMVAAGYAKYNLELMDGQEVGVDTLFAYFPQWKTMLIANVLQAVYVLLWTLLFIIPGIIAAYRYSMTYFILAENPELTASEAISRSKELMSGNKWRLFCLEFSFIGWAFLASLTPGIGNLFLTPYRQAASAAFYRDITGRADEIRLEPVLLEG